MGNFLDDLKKAVDTGDFNSEAANKINEIDKLANKKFTPDSSFDDKLDMVDERLKQAGNKSVTKEEAEIINSDYEKKMAEIKKQDAINLQLAMLIEIEEAVRLTVGDMFNFIHELKKKFDKEFEEKDPAYFSLLEKINEINSRYNNSIIN
jgi:hypothetical protein